MECIRIRDGNTAAAYNSSFQFFHGFLLISSDKKIRRILICKRIVDIKKVFHGSVQE